MLVFTVISLEDIYRHIFVVPTFKSDFGRAPMVRDFITQSFFEILHGSSLTDQIS